MFGEFTLESMNTHGCLHVSYTTLPERVHGNQINLYRTRINTMKRGFTKAIHKSLKSQCNTGRRWTLIGTGCFRGNTIGLLRPLSPRLLH